MATYISNTIPGLTLTTPTEGSSRIPELNDAIREVKRALQYAFTVLNITNADSPYTALTTSSIIFANATDGAITVNLPTAVGISGRRYIIKKTDSSANAVTVDGNGSQTIDGSTTKILLNQYDCIEIYSDGANWQISSKKYDDAILTSKTGNYTVTVNDCNGVTVFTNDGAIGAVTFTLPTAVAGQRVSFIVVEAQNLIIVPGTSDSIRIGGSTATTDIRSSTIGDTVDLVCINAVEWIALNSGSAPFTVN